MEPDGRRPVDWVTGVERADPGCSALDLWNLQKNTVIFLMVGGNVKKSMEGMPRELNSYYHNSMLLCC